MSRPHRSLLGYVWAAPATALGLVLALVARVLGARAAVVDGTLEVGGGRFGRLVAALPRFLRFGAITFGHVIVGTDGDALRTARSHEQVHVRQYERWGILFFPLYLGSSLWEVLRGRSAYRGNAFEREARRLGGG